MRFGGVWARDCAGAGRVLTAQPTALAMGPDPGVTCGWYDHTRVTTSLGSLQAGPWFPGLTQLQGLRPS